MNKLLFVLFHGLGELFLSLLLKMVDMFDFEIAFLCEMYIWLTWPLKESKYSMSYGDKAWAS
jgi:hypothetical protein